ncbi:unnamed protein product [Camellia sinensis]
MYKGKLNDGREIAVKKPFLDYLLFNSKTSRSDALEWKQTYDIIVAIARGLLYLPEQSHSVIIHYDIKPTNILIDENWVPMLILANELYKEGRESEFIDQKLIPSAIVDRVQLCVHIGIMCTEYDPELRPTMGRVYSMLSENHSSNNTLDEEPMRDGSSSASSTARNSGPTKLTNNGSSSRADIHLENEGLPKHRGLTHARRIQPKDVQSYIPSIPSSSCSSMDGPIELANKGSSSGTDIQSRLCLGRPSFSK